MRNPFRLLPAAPLAVLALAASAAEAQVIRGPAGPVVTPVGPVAPGPWIDGVGGYGYGGLDYPAPAGFGYPNAGAADRAATADVIGAAGQYNKDTAEAARTFEQARQHWIENQLTAFKTYQTKKQIGQQLQQREQDEDRERARRYREQATHQTPEFLGPNELDGQTGAIRWPIALKAEDYAEARQRLDDLFAIRARAGSTPETGQEIMTVAGLMLDGLRARVHLTPAPEYLQARNFLAAVQNEGRYR